MPITRKQRQALFERAGGVCERCHRPPDWRGLSLAHILPKQMGGNKARDVPENIEVLCYPCHSKDHGIKEAASEPSWWRP